MLRGGDSLEVDRKNIGIGAVFQYFGSASTLIGGVIFYTYVVKYYSQTIYASIGVMQAILSIVTTVFIFGLSQALQHFISNHMAKGETDKVRSLLKKSFTMLVFLMSGSFLTIFLLSPILVRFLLIPAGISSASAYESVAFLSVASASYVGSTIVNSMVLGFQKFKTNGFLVLLNAITAYGSASILLYRFRDSQAVAAGWAASYTFMLIIGLIILAAIARSAKPRHSEEVRQMDMHLVLRYSIPILLASIVSTGSVYTDRLIVDTLVGGNVFAVYSYALVIASSVSFLVSPLNNILLPKFSEYFSYNDAHSIRRGIRLTINVATFIYTPIAMWIAVLGMPIILVLGKVDYIDGALPL
ncbi:transporter, partial [mine drainage metagenome]